MCWRILRALLLGPYAVNADRATAERSCNNTNTRKTITMNIIGQRSRVPFRFLLFIFILAAANTASAQAGFSLSAAPASLTIPQNGHGVSVITAAISGGFDSSITLSASGVPSGTSVTFNPSTIAAPGAGTSTMTITVLSIARIGTYPITVTGNGGGVQ